MESNFGLMVHEVLKTQKLVFANPVFTLMFQLSIKLIRKINVGLILIFSSQKNLEYGVLVVVICLVCIDSHILHGVLVIVFCMVYVGSCS